LTTLFVVTICALSAVTYAALVTIKFDGLPFYVTDVTGSIYYSTNNINWNSKLENITLYSSLYAEIKDLNIAGYTGNIEIEWTLYKESVVVNAIVQSFSYSNTTATISATQSGQIFDFIDWISETNKAYYITAEISQVS
jgi:hypothetical protein